MCADMIIDNDPPITRNISIPRDMSSLSCSSFTAGIVEAVLDGLGFVSHFSQFRFEDQNLIVLRHPASSRDGAQHRRGGHASADDDSHKTREICIGARRGAEVMSPRMRMGPVLYPVGRDTVVRLITSSLSYLLTPTIVLHPLSDFDASDGDVAQIGRVTISPPLINTSCAWAGEKHELQALFDCPFTGAVTTRTATIDGFKEDATHTVRLSPSRPSPSGPELTLRRSCSPLRPSPRSTRMDTPRTRSRLTSPGSASSSPLRQPPRSPSSSASPPPRPSALRSCSARSKTCAPRSTTPAKQRRGSR